MKETSISSISCDSTRVLTQFFSYYEGEKIEFAYEPLARFRTVSNANSDQVALELLKILAAERCADGIINISQTQFKEEAKSKVSIQPTDINSAIITSNKLPQYAYTGLAVKLKDTSKHLRMDQEFLTKYHHYRAKKNQKTKLSTPCEECDAKRGSKGLIIAGSCLAILFGILVLVSK